MKNEYIPGVCNIGKEEIAFRRKAGVVGLTVSVVFVIALYLLGLPNIFRIIIFFPLFGSFVGLYQARFHFCANFAMRGIFNFQSLGLNEHINQNEFRKKDQATAFKIILLSILSALLLTIIFILI